MRAITDQFCAFCKDAKARMSFISYYKAITELFSNSSDLLNRYRNQDSLNSTISKLNKSLQLFYHWDYEESVRTLIQVYYQLEDAIREAKHWGSVYTQVIPIAITMVAIALVSTVLLLGIRMRRKMKQSMENTKRSAERVSSNLGLKSLVVA